MAQSYVIKIDYRDGKTEKRYVDDYGVKDGLLILYKRFGVDAGTSCIPFDQIKEFRIDR